MKILDIRSPFDKEWQNRDPFTQVFELEGEEFRNVKNRRTFRIEVSGKGFFIKIHRGVGWKEIIKNLLQFKLPVTGADNEYRALEKLKTLGVPTMEIAAFGRRNFNPANRESFLITEELTGVISLEDLAAQGIEAGLKRKLIRALARSAGMMHRAGINHRDCYICHYLLKKSSVEQSLPLLYVIDLHRAQIRRKVPFRYQVKDVGGLCFSAFDLPLSKRDIWLFIREYSGRDVKKEWSENNHFWRAVYRNARKLYFKEFKHFPAEDPFAGM